ncbi:hypothetical protein B296_00043111 [Ensete ventricosum]|uniref:Uncharacterized protein n=1 Tax=Ensete ventricosum TaxID=4639 RepID=A0A426ZG05_ENSVE|nr:hypothetical protein B296_00043111 [Ensete ventricosum]
MVWSAVAVDADSEDGRDNGDNDCRIKESKRGTSGGGQQLRISNDGPFLLEMPTTRRGGTVAIGSGLRLRNQWQRERENDGLRLQSQWHRERENDGLRCWQPTMTVVCWHMKKRAVAGMRKKAQGAGGCNCDAVMREDGCKILEEKLQQRLVVEV